jgi:hypothetical protein
LKKVFVLRIRKGPRVASLLGAAIFDLLASVSISRHSAGIRCDGPESDWEPKSTVAPSCRASD